MKRQRLFLLKDEIFKAMFKESKAFRELLSNIFIHFFDFDLSKFNITSEELSIDKIKDIKNRVDLLLELENDKYLVNIEVNNGNKDYYPNRNLMYVCKIVFKLFKKTSDYTKKFKVVQININDIECPLDEDIVTTTLTLKDNEHNISDERMIIHNLYLGKYKKLPYNELNEIEKDLALLVCEDINKMQELIKESKLREEIMSEYKNKIVDEEFIMDVFDPEWDRQCIINSERSLAREEGLEEGRKEGIKEIAKSLLNANMPIEDISKHTGLTIEQIKMLINK